MSLTPSGLIPPAPPPSSPESETAVMERLEKELIRANRFLKKPDMTVGRVKRWFNGAVRNQIAKIYGKNSDVMKVIPMIDRKSSESPNDILKRCIIQITAFIETVKQAGQQFEKSSIGKVFIGHGRSHVWRELKDFLSETLNLDWDEFNREEPAGYSTFERLSEMLKGATFAFLIMTAEDEHSDSTIHARENVVHEIGLFQGQLGSKKAIILLEDGCQEFSNIYGLTQIRFPKDDISARFENIRRVLKREGIIE